MSETTHIPADVRERVAREVFALDDDWRREYWDKFRRAFPGQAQAYYDTADRILTILRRTPRAEEEVWCAFLDALGGFEEAVAERYGPPSRFEACDSDGCFLGEHQTFAEAAAAEGAVEVRYVSCGPLRCFADDCIHARTATGSRRTEARGGRA